MDQKISVSAAMKNFLRTLKLYVKCIQFSTDCLKCKSLSLFCIIFPSMWHSLFVGFCDDEMNEEFYCIQILHVACLMETTLKWMQTWQKMKTKQSFQKFRFKFSAVTKLLKRHVFLSKQQENDTFFYGFVSVISCEIFYRKS